jgi:hypothetical protein
VVDKYKLYKICVHLPIIYDILDTSMKDLKFDQHLDVDSNIIDGTHHPCFYVLLRIHKDHN